MHNTRMVLSPLSNSFGSSLRRMGRLSSATDGAVSESSSHEGLSILSDHQSADRFQGIRQRRSSSNGTVLDSIDRNEVVVRVDAVGGDSSSLDVSQSTNNMKRDPTFVFVQQKMQDMDDQSSELVDQLLNRQKMVNGGDSLDMDVDLEIDMDELRNKSNGRNLPPPLPESPLSKRSSWVSFEPSVSGGIEFDSAVESDRRQPCKEESQPFCTPPHGQRKQSRDNKCDELLLSSLKPKSRLLDPPPEILERMSGKTMRSGQSRSGMLSRVLDDDEEDDLLKDEDFPKEYRRNDSSKFVVFQWVSLVTIVGALVCSLSIRALREEKILQLKLWKWEVLLLVLICGRLVSGWGVHLIVFFIERNFLLRKRVLYFVYGLKKEVQNCWWLGLALLAWRYLFDEKVQRDTNSNVLKYVTKVLVCLLVANFIWLIKTLVVKVLASSFHMNKYCDRIQESVFNQFVIETLSGPPLIEIERNEEEIEMIADEVRQLQHAGATVPPNLNAAVFLRPKAARVIGKGGLYQFFKRKSSKISQQFFKKREEGITIDHLHQLNTKNISAWNMKRLMKIVRHCSLSTLDEQVLDGTTEDEYVTRIRSEYEAKAAARKIFYNVARPGSKFIYLDDLMRFMREDEALKTINFFESASETKKITKSSLKNWLVNAFRERRALALTLNDTKTAVKKLHRIVQVIVGIVIVIICLVILELATSRFFLLLGSQIVLGAFTFGNTCKITFESIIFLFIIHPFDVGDRCQIDGVELVVEEMNILTTSFLRDDEQKIVYPNSILATKPIGNYYRSPDMADDIHFYVHIATPVEKINVMRQRIISCIEGNKEHWYPKPIVILTKVEDLDKLKISVWLKHRMNHQDMGERWKRVSFLLEELVVIFRELDIQYRLFPLDVNIRTMPPFNH